VPGSSSNSGIRIDLAALAARHPAAARDAPAALSALTLSIAAGEQVAVIGPSGAGKTTLLQAIACALRPAAGRLLLDGEDPWSLPVARLQRLRGRLFLAPQTPPLPPRQRTITSLLAARLPRQSLWTSLRSLVYPVGIEDAHAALERFDLAENCGRGSTGSPAESASASGWRARCWLPRIYGWSTSRCRPSTPPAPSWPSRR
jgi:phosphonate transport system ATP-binding protein